MATAAIHTAHAAHGAHAGVASIETGAKTKPIHYTSRKDSAGEGLTNSTPQKVISSSETGLLTNAPSLEIHDFDMLIIGAGISGINMAYRYQESFPERRYIVLEQRENIGGTWDLMRYPGIRSDSDLHTFGFAWRPWPEKIPIAEGGAILEYMKESAAQYGIDKNILFQHKVKESNWSSREQAWIVQADAIDEQSGKTIVKHFRGKFVVLGTGYYNYDKPLEANISGIGNFKGRVVHPQFWPKDLDYANKKVAIIGSGATTITLLPALAKTAKKVTMVQRSPSYIVSMANRTTPRWWEMFVPRYIQQRLTRIMYLFIGIWLRRMMKNPKKMREWMTKDTKKLLPASIPFDPHFNPKYDPWTQRVCLCPDGDFFEALQEGKAGVATGVIRTVTDTSIVLESGETIEADIIITATGLHLQYGGNSAFKIDSEPLDWHTKFLWRGSMIQDVPNLMLVQGYTTASWTLGADATAHMTCRMLKYFQRNKYSSATPRVTRSGVVEQNWEKGLMGLTSTYIRMAKGRLPKNGVEDPWRARKDYLWDLWFAKFGDLRKGLSFVECVGE
ncbi:High osmolarity signaling protein [Venturia nashicola]|uniref:High osmolarity signaling protein n=1 Tax=Venturia nashicola TaxID=86259 RepID=A0A4Z1PAH0_9PEZI|nr:High osmolarity signaling protein [Venturia nashicola]